jgi:hypothetical protein
MLTFTDALVLLGAEPPRLAALDRALGGALNLATGGVSGSVIAMADANGRLIGLGRDAVQGVGARLGRAEGRAERTELLRAAHTVIVVVAFFEAMSELELPFDLRQVELTRMEQLSLARTEAAPVASARRATGLVDLLLAADLPCPAPHTAPDAVRAALSVRYGEYADRFLRFLEGLALWEELTPSRRERARGSLTRLLPRSAHERYASLATQLAVQAPEFAYWTTQMAQQATHVQVSRALAGVEALLARTAEALRPPVDVAAALARAHRAALDRSVLDAETAPDGIRLPTVEELYLDPDFRVSGVPGSSEPTDERWWERIPVRTDLTRYLAGALTSPHLAEAPLLVLGQPGAGKSVLTRVLAARLPSVGFLPVRVPLRDVRAEDDLQAQVEHAVRTATGEKISWPELVRSAGGSTPVLLLDGFDELLQTTGVHQSNYLERVAQFQQREADQGRPVLALVTSRTAVADRARFPDGIVVLRLEPFRPEHIRQWLTVWNATNAAGFAASRRSPLAWEHIERHVELAAQPLLLTMLALYDATEGTLQAAGDLDVTQLYERLLSSFARREVEKETQGAVPEEETAALVERELQRLSLVAFAQLNRGRQWVSAEELEQDLTAVLGRQPVRATGFRTPLNPAEVVLGRFFFVQRAQSRRDGQVLATYEFLHATFGEYLAVRLALHLLEDLLAPRPTLALGGHHIHDDLAYALLSYTSLASRQMLRYARSMTEAMPQDKRRRLGELLIHVMAQHEHRTGDQLPAYRPTALRTTARHGLYGSNLALMSIVLSRHRTASTMFPGAEDPVGTWHRHCLLWRSAMDESQWTDFAGSLHVHHYWDSDGRALNVSLRSHAARPPDALDMNWLFRYPQGHGGPGWSRSYWEDLWLKMAVSGGTNDSVARHTLDPVFRWLGQAVTVFTPAEGAPASSLAHDLLELLLADRGAVPDDQLVDLHARALRGARLMFPTASTYLVRTVDVLMTTFSRDRERLPEEASRALGEFLGDDVVPLVLGEHERVPAPPPFVSHALFQALWSHEPVLAVLVPPALLERLNEHRPGRTRRSAPPPPSG